MSPQRPSPDVQSPQAVTLEQVLESDAEQIRDKLRKLRNLHRRVPLTNLGFTDGWNGDEWNDGWSFDEWNDEWNDDWRSVGWHEGCEQTYDISASSFSLVGLDVSATSSPKRFEWVKMNLDTGGCSERTFPLNFGPEGVGDGRFYRTASGEWIPDGGSRQFQWIR